MTRVMSCHHTQIFPSTGFVDLFPRNCFDSSLGDGSGKIPTFISMLNPQSHGPRRLNVKFFHNLIRSIRKLPRHLLRSRSSNLADVFHYPLGYHSRLSSNRRRRLLRTCHQNQSPVQNLVTVDPRPSNSSKQSRESAPGKKANNVSDSPKQQPSSRTHGLGCSSKMSNSNAYSRRKKSP